jgi:Reverse transcriptase (RNA-dependent DNA polymerase)
VNPYEGCIEDFLGPDILGNPVVRNSKISPELNAELDKAIEVMCSKSAGGPDGLFLQKFCKKYWHIFRNPLCAYAKTCIDKGNLTPSFLTASIKLIPKKGDRSNIKNWCPISLLNVLYKVVSKALNNRLKKVAGTVITRSQKGFCDKKYIQECLINICETINHGNTNNIPSFCLALDQSKAFDSVDHSFMREVYRFFGFGNKFIDILTVLTTGRNAAIILDDGSLSEPFPLDGGHTQGNAPSPLLFNFCQQILIFKIEFCPSILPVSLSRFEMAEDRAPPVVPPASEGEEAPAPVPAAPPAQATAAADDPAVRAGEPGNTVIKDNKVEAFADDATVLGQAKAEAVIAIKAILKDFYRISGLQCSLDKSTIMFFGTGNNAAPEWAAELGFPIVKTSHILGCTIDISLLGLWEHFEKTIKNIRNIKLFWTRFNLSLPGRLGIAKSLMLAQLAYLRCIIEPTRFQLDTIRTLLLREG